MADKDFEIWDEGDHFAITIWPNMNRGQSTNLDRLAAALSSGWGNGVVSKLRNVETRSLPTLTHCSPRNFAFYVAFPESSIPLIATC